MTYDQIKLIIDQVGGWVLIWICAYCILGPTKNFITREVKELTK